MLFINKWKAYTPFSWIINNNNGVENINHIYYNPKKKGTKISIISDNEIPFDIIVGDINKNDRLYLNDHINNLNLTNKNIIGDKGYLWKRLKENLINTKNINMITSYKKNQHLKNTPNELILLKSRRKIEHLFKKIKISHRINNREDKKISNFKSFLYLNLIDRFKDCFLLY